MHNPLICARCGKRLTSEQVSGGSGCPRCRNKTTDKPMPITGITCPFCKGMKTKVIEKGVLTCSQCNKTFTWEEKEGIELFESIQKQTKPHTRKPIWNALKDEEQRKSLETVTTDTTNRGGKEHESEVKPSQTEPTPTQRLESTLASSKKETPKSYNTCPRCYKFTLWFNVEDGTFKCQNRKCQATGRSMTNLQSVTRLPNIYWGRLFIAIGIFAFVAFTAWVIIQYM